MFCVFAGFMFDRTGAYTVPFVVSGILLLIGGALVLSLICLDKSHKTAKTTEQPEEMSVDKSATVETMLNHQDDTCTTQGTHQNGVLLSGTDSTTSKTQETNPNGILLCEKDCTTSKA